MRVGDVLLNYVAVPLVDLRLLTQYSNAFTARAALRLHNVHQLVSSAFSLHAKFTVIIGKDISLRYE